MDSLVHWVNCRMVTASFSHLLERGDDIRWLVAPGTRVNQETWEEITPKFPPLSSRRLIKKVKMICMMIFHS